MNEKLKKEICEALKASSEESVHEGLLEGAISLLLEGDKKLGFYLTVFDLDDPTDQNKRHTAFCGEPDQVAMALGMEMIDEDDVRFILNNAKVTLDLFNEDLPEEEKLK